MISYRKVVQSVSSKYKLQSNRLIRTRSDDIQEHVPSWHVQVIERSYTIVPMIYYRIDVSIIDRTCTYTQFLKIIGSTYISFYSKISVCHVTVYVKNTTLKSRVLQGLSSNESFKYFLSSVTNFSISYVSCTFEVHCRIVEQEVEHKMN